MKKILIMTVAALTGFALSAAPQRTVVGAAPGGQSPFATDAYPGFDGLDDVPKPERREKSWWFGVKRATPAEQLAFAEELEKKGDFKGAAKACDALVREWPSAIEAPKAQLHFVHLLAGKLEDYEEAFTQLEYLLDFYARDCAYLELVDYGYKLVNTMVDKKKSWFGLSFLSNRLVRQHYESIVRRAPGASFVAEAMLKIAKLREDDQQYEEAQKVYAALQSKYPLRAEARLGAYREALARMWLCRRLGYNQARCKDTRGFFAHVMARYPDLEQLEEIKKCDREIADYMEKEAYLQAKSYDTKRRTRHAACSAWEQFLKNYPNSPHAEEVRLRILELSQTPAPTPAP